MALEVTTLRGQMVGGGILSDRRLFLAADRLTVVEVDDPQAAFLLCGEGSEIPVAEAQRLRLSVVSGRVVQDAPVVKEADRPEDKQAAPPKENKAKGRR